MHKKILFICLALLALFSLARFTGNTDYWLVDIFSNFPVQYSLVAIPLIIAGLWKKMLPLTICAALLFVVNISVLIDPGTSVQAAAYEQNTFKVYSANIDKSNRDYPRLLPVLMESKADILLLLEVTDKNIKSLEPLFSTYPYRIENINLSSSRTGAALLSKFPILEREVIKYSEFGNLLISAMLEINNKKVMFYGVHLPRPAFTKEYAFRFEQAQALAEKISAQSVPVIVVGDLNASPYTPIFKQLVSRSGLKDSREGFGWQPSWPTYFPFLWIPIDHILVSPGIRVHNRATGAYLSSDHYPVFAELSMD